MENAKDMLGRILHEDDLVVYTINNSLTFGIIKGGRLWDYRFTGKNPSSAALYVKHDTEQLIQKRSILIARFNNTLEKQKKPADKGIPRKSLVSGTVYRNKHWDNWHFVGTQGKLLVFERVRCVGSYGTDRTINNKWEAIASKIIVKTKTVHEIVGKITDLK